MKSVVLGVLLFLLAASTASARGTYIYEARFDVMGRNYLDRLDDKATDNLDALPASKRALCVQRYKDILDDGQIDIRIALGYFDWTTGSNVYAEGRSFGLSPSLDLGAFAALRKLLLSPCSGRARFCGFTQDPSNVYRFRREVIVHGVKYPARIDVHFSSATEFLESNLGRMSREQNERTSFMDSYFAKALENADAVFYFGHARNGGGPDFSPPVFVRGRNKVDYDGYYEVQRPGLKKMLAALSGPKKTPILGLMACNSRDHFLKKVRATAPHTGVITSLDVLNVDEVYTATIGGIDAILRGQCQQTFYQSLRLTPNNQKYITMDGMFE
ncbi:hypothetical protein [Bdellovibrio sp. ArHS]|uniref:hypothetical protein n=1 Tax=Bdellovibrio sp. ArHS TaxID=1569284 RepID=UPI000A8C437F|nr:hypothetical protein [Bdellovibrio sp. ArHS]